MQVNRWVEFCTDWLTGCRAFADSINTPRCWFILILFSFFWGSHKLSSFSATFFSSVSSPVSSLLYVAPFIIPVPLFHNLSLSLCIPISISISISLWTVLWRPSQSLQYHSRLLSLWFRGIHRWPRSPGWEIGRLAQTPSASWCRERGKEEEGKVSK